MSSSDASSDTKSGGSKPLLSSKCKMQTVFKFRPSLIGRSTDCNFMLRLALQFQILRKVIQTYKIRVNDWHCICPVKLRAFRMRALPWRLASFPALPRLPSSSTLFYILFLYYLLYILPRVPYIPQSKLSGFFILIGWTDNSLSLSSQRSALSWVDKVRRPVVLWLIDWISQI